MADKEMRDESSAALLAALSKPMEVEAWGIEQESGSCAAPMEAEGSAPGSLAHEKTQPTPERTGPIHVEKDSSKGRGAAGDLVEGEPGGGVHGGPDIIR